MNTRNIYIHSFGHTLFFLILMLLCSRCSAQGFRYREVTNIPGFLEKFDEASARQNILAGKKFVDITKYLPKGFVKNGTVDYTKFLQIAFQNNNYILMPDFPLLINDNGIDISSQSIVVFRPNSKLILKASSKSNYEILRIHNRFNVVIFSPVIIGDRKIHLTQNGEWGMGISIKSSRNIDVINPNISDCWGDGIYLGQSGNTPNQDISIRFGKIDNNRRDGISVISARGLRIENIVLSNTNGTNPQAGIDFEPNKDNEVLQDVYLKNIYTYNNKNQGVYYCLNNLNGSSNKVSISLVNHVDRYAKNAIAIMNVIPKKKLVSRSMNSMYPLAGNLDLKNVKGIDNKVHLLIFDKSRLEGLKINLHTNNSDDFKAQGEIRGISITR